MSILVAPYATPDIAIYLDRVQACVTDHGGLTCHLASVAREKGVLCIVGTGNATEVIKTGDYVIVDGFGSVGKVEISNYGGEK